METNQAQQPKTQHKFISYFKFLCSLVLLLIAYNTLSDISAGSSALVAPNVLWGAIFLIWGVLWCLQLPSLSKIPVIQKIIGNLNFKKIVRWLMVLLCLALVVAVIIGAFDNFIPGLGAKDLFIILLAPVLH